MLPKDMEELEQHRIECRRLVTKRACVSGAAAVVPVPGVDVGVDVALLMEMLSTINERFGLSPEQIDHLDPETKKWILVLATSVGSELIGRYITKGVVVQVLKRISVRFATKQVTKYIPFVGQALAVGVSFSAMKYVGNSHVNECYEVVRNLLEDGQREGQVQSSV